MSTPQEIYKKQLEEMKNAYPADVNLDLLGPLSSKDLKDIRGCMQVKLEDLHAQTNKFTKAEQQKFDTIAAKIEEIDRRLEPHKQKLEAIRRKHARQTGDSSNDPDVETWEAVSGDQKGAKIKVLNNRASLKAQHQFQGQERSMAEYLRDRVRGYTESNSFSNDMSTTTDSALIPEPLAARLIDKARAKSRVLTAGAKTVEMDSKTLTIAKVSEDGDSSVEWKPENEAHTPSDVNFEPLTFEAHTLIGSVKSSVELAEDSGNLASLVEDNLAAQIALELDRAAMLGTGEGAEPTGIANTEGTQQQVLGTTDGAPLTDYSDFSRAYESILAANGEPNAVIFAPRTWGTLDRLTASDGQPLMAPQSYKELEKYQTKQIPTDLTRGASDNASIAIVGDWSQCMIGVRTKLRLEVSRSASGPAESAFEKLQIWFRAYARYDVQLAHSEMFSVINGIIPAS